MAIWNDPMREWFSHRGLLTRAKGNVSLAAVFSGLVAATAVRHFWPEVQPALIAILQTGFEAGTVGGAADWLAVKMIFDEIKIGRWKIVPASGIIPRKQAAIAQGAGKLVATEWLTPESVQNMLRNLDASEFLASTIESWKRSGQSRQATAWLIDRLNDWLAKEETRRHLTGMTDAFLRELRLSRWIGQSGSETHIRQILGTLVPYLCDKTADLLTTPEAFTLIHDKLLEEQDTFFKKLMYDPAEATEKTILKATVLLREIQFDEHHPVRQRLAAAAGSWVRRLGEGGKEADEFDSMASGILEAIPVDRWVERVVTQVRDFLDAQKINEESPLHRMMDEWIEEAVHHLRTNPSWKKSVNERIIGAAGELMASHHDKIADIVTENLRKLSPDQIKEQFRSRTYDDMQWIRVNGAVAGFAIGILIGTVRWFGGW